MTTSPAEKVCEGEGCDYEVMLMDTESRALAKTVAKEACFHEDNDSPKADLYKELVADRFEPSDRMRLKNCATCLLTACVNGHKYYGATPEHQYGVIV